MWLLNITEIQENQLFSLPFYRKEMDSLGETGPGPVGDLGFSLVPVLVLVFWVFLNALLSGGTWKVHSGQNRGLLMLVPRGNQYCDLLEGGGSGLGECAGCGLEQKKKHPCKGVLLSTTHGFDVPKLPLNHEELSVCLPSPREGQLKHLLSRETVLGMGTPTS